MSQLTKIEKQNNECQLFFLPSFFRQVSPEVQIRKEKEGCQWWFSRSCPRLEAAADAWTHTSIRLPSHLEFWSCLSQCS